jgi:hypothetical protein
MEEQKATTDGNGLVSINLAVGILDPTAGIQTAFALHLVLALS